MPPVGDQELVRLIRRVLADSPFAGEGYRKVRARLRREHGVRVSGKRVLRLLRREGLLAPQRARGRRRPRPHDGTIIPDRPNVRWGTDATMAWTRTDGWVWVFAVVDHYSAEAWAHVAKIGDRFAALQPVYDAVYEQTERTTDRFTATWYDQFPGGCVTSRLRSTTDIQGTFATQAPLVLGFTTRQALQQALEERSNRRLHLDPPAPR